MPSPEEMDEEIRSWRHRHWKIQKLIIAAAMLLCIVVALAIGLGICEIVGGCRSVSFCR